MDTYTSETIEQYFKQYEQHITHIVVAHTTFCLDKIRKSEHKHAVDCARSDLRHALNHFARLLYPTQQNRPKRNPYKYKPLSLVTMEGAQRTAHRTMTIHFNICLGNLPAILTTDDIQTLFAHAWHDKAHQSADVKAYDYRSHNAKTWLGYQLKEAQQNPTLAWAADGVWDVENCWIPHAAFNAD